MQIKSLTLEVKTILTFNQSLRLRVTTKLQLIKSLIRTFMGFTYP